MTIDVDIEESETSDDRPLRFEEDKQCGTHCIIVFNTHTGAAHLIHVHEAANLGLYEEQKDSLEEFLKTPGEKYAVRITDMHRTQLCEGAIQVSHEGSHNDDIEHHEDHHSAKFQVEQHGVAFLDDIEVQSGEARHWEVIFDPKTREITISCDKGEEIQTYIRTQDKTGREKLEQASFRGRPLFGENEIRVLNERQEASAQGAQRG